MAITLARPLALLAMFCAASAQAQLARKPSYYEGGQEPASLVARPSSDPAQRMGDKRSVPELPAIANRNEFDQLARVYDAGTPLAQPHVIFVIDRQAKPARILFVNTPRFQLHERFLRETGRFKGSRDQFNRNYKAADRRFILGTLNWQPQIQRFVHEFWEGDQLTPELLRTTEQLLGTQFYADSQFKANSSAQEKIARDAGIGVVTQAELIGQQSFLPLNIRSAVGRLRIVTDVDNAANSLRPSDIVVLREVPISLPPVAGVITERPSTMISHVNLLAKGWGIPNAFVKDAMHKLATLNGHWVYFDVSAKDYILRAATDQERLQAEQRLNATRPARTAVIASDLKTTQLKPLANLRAAHRTQCGAKAAHLGEVRAARIANTMVPDGFCVPFGQYAKAMQDFGLRERVARMMQQPGFDTYANVRRDALAQLRSDIEKMPIDAAVSSAWRQRWSQQLRAEGVFVRSSSSSEDLPHFSGAGLYTTVPNVRDADALTSAVRKVWASVFNFEAWEARQAAGIAHDAVVMAVLVQQAVNSQVSGVMITRSPLDNTPYTTFIAAKRGLGIRVVDGQRVAEQVLYSSWSKAIQVISQSDEKTALQLDPRGGVREVPLSTAERVVLSDERVKLLAGVGKQIESRFGGKPQDIEWALTDEQRVIVLQARPFVTAPGR